MSAPSLLGDGGKLWPQVGEVAQSVGLLTHLRALVEAARRARIVVFYVPHRRWREGNYDGWRHPAPWQTLIDREVFFGEASGAASSIRNSYPSRATL